jgi:hypothetical protein
LSIIAFAPRPAATAPAAPAARPTLPLLFLIALPMLEIDAPFTLSAIDPTAA